MNTSHIDKLICPYCEHVEPNAWEINFGGIEGETTAYCGECGLAYYATRHCSVSYSSKAKKPNGGKGGEG